MLTQLLAATAATPLLFATEEADDSSDDQDAHQSINQETSAV